MSATYHQKMLSFQVILILNYCFFNKASHSSTVDLNSLLHFPKLTPSSCNNKTKVIPEIN